MGTGTSNRSSSTNKEEKKYKKGRTGCKAGVGLNSGKPWVSGFNYHRGWTFIAGPYSGSTVTRSASGVDWETWVAKFKINGMPKDGVVPCLYNIQTGNLHFNDLGPGMVAKPKSPNGGYFGRAKKSLSLALVLVVSSCCSPKAVYYFPAKKPAYHPAKVQKAENSHKEH